MNPTLALIALLGAGCGADKNTVVPSQSTYASGDPAAPATTASAGPTAPVAAAPTPTVSPARSSGGKAPLYVLFFTHHFRGQGGFYPSSDHIRATAQACLDQDMAPYCTLFFDGVLVDRLAQEDPELPAFLRKHGFPIGYHGEEAHGPYPVVVAVEALSGKDAGQPQVEQPGWTFAQTVDALKKRYTHAFQRPTLGSDGYLRRAEGGSSDLANPGGVARVEQWLGQEATLSPGHLVFQPAAAFAFDVGDPIPLFQGAGVFAPHFLKNTRNPELINATNEFLGAQTSLFWFMGRLVEKGRTDTQIPVWSTEGKVEPASRGGGGRGGGFGDDEGGGGGGRFGDGAGQRDGAGQGDGARFRGKAGGGGGGGRGPGGGGAGAEQRGGGGGFGPGGGDDTPGAAMKKAFLAVERSTPQLVQVHIGGLQEHTRSGLAWVKEQQAQDPAITFVTGATVHQVIHPSQEELEPTAVAAAALKYWGDGPADYLVVDQQAVSLADGFEVMVRHLAGAKGPVRTTDVIGPVGQASDLVTATGTVAAADVRAAAPSVVKAIDASPWHAMPTTVQVGDTTVGFHQYYWLMASVIAGREGPIELPRTSYSPPFARLLAGLLRGELPDQTFRMEAQFWTAKPVRWR